MKCWMTGKKARLSICMDICQRPCKELKERTNELTKKSEKLFKKQLKSTD